MWAASEAEEGMETYYLPEPAEEMQPCQQLHFSPVTHFRLRPLGI